MTELMVIDCDHCERTTTCVPIRDEYTARTWCSQDCRDEAEEADWLRRWSA